MADQYQHHHDNNQLLFSGELDKLQLTISVICDEYEWVLEVFDEQLIELVQLTHGRDLHELFLHDSLEVEQQIVDDRLLLLVAACKRIQEGPGL